MKKVTKLMVILLIVACCITVIPQGKSYAKDVSVGSIASGIKPTDPAEKNYSDLAKVVGKIMAFLQIASGLTSVVVIAFVGFELITTMPETRKKIIQKMFPIVIGIVLVFGATSIGKFIMSVTGNTGSLNTYDRTQVVQNGE